MKKPIVCRFTPVKSSLAPCARVIVFLMICFLEVGFHQGFAASFDLPDLGDYEVFSMAGKNEKLTPTRTKTLLRETPRNAVCEDGLTGLFLAETADHLQGKRMFSSLRAYDQKLDSRFGTGYHSSETGHLTTLELSTVYIGEWCEVSVVVPIHDYTLSAPRTYSTPAAENSGIGDMKLGFKATYLPDKSYYRWAYGTVVTASTGDTSRMRPAGSKNQDELKLFGCVTTKETDNAVGNVEIGAILNSSGDHSRFIYRAGFSYGMTQHVDFIGELAGDVEGGNDKDTLDLVGGFRLAHNPTTVLEFAYTRNLRTYREYGFSDRIQGGITIRW